MADAVAIISMVLLFVLIFGLSGTVEPTAVLGQFKRGRPLLVGMSCQFLLLPLCGFATVHALDLQAAVAVPLILTTSSPGGSFSNFWCALANADLSLSVAMTTVNTVVAMAMLPLNVLLYVEVLLGSQGVRVPIASLAPPLAVVVGAVALGLLAAHCLPARRHVLNRLGGLAGGALVLAALLAPKDGGGMSPSVLSPLLLAAVALPCLAGLVVTTLLATLVPGISRPERTALGIETCFQNTSIALAVALQTPEQAEGVAVPLLYGAMEVLCISVWAFLAWRLGYTYAPPSDGLLRALCNNYQPQARPAAVAPEAEKATEAEAPERGGAALHCVVLGPALGGVVVPPISPTSWSTAVASQVEAVASDGVLSSGERAKLWRRRTPGSSTPAGGIRLPEAWAPAAENEDAAPQAPGGPEAAGGEPVELS
mmetsp:Transcript_101208/g.326664  ORF Transcript_101208/g.326664 Transcript_101208/m.326664 type:complete len:426 (+) Transcript_101208:85-1362(+)